jgi:glycosyltransferase involved in cell wall biosynthesis
VTDKKQKGIVISESTSDFMKGKKKLKENPLVSVGIPTYNRPEGLRQTLTCITGQTYKNLDIIISDNFSPGSEVEAVVQEFIIRDNRIRYYRQGKNIGMHFNFNFVLDMAKGDYFMWASDDDIWDEEFISSCMRLLAQNKKIGLSFCNFVNIDTFGRIIREYPFFITFTGINSYTTIYRYLVSPEICGKCNIFMGVYRTTLCKNIWKKLVSTDEVWGGDNCLVLGILAKSGIAIDPKVLFYKRIARTTDTKDHIDKIIIKNPKNHIFPFNESFSYLKNNLKAVKGTKYYWLTLFVILIRIPRSFLIFVERGLIKVLKIGINFFKNL